MTEDQQELLKEACDSIAAARLLLSGGYSGYVSSCAYDAMLYIAEAFLESEGMAFSKHSAVIAAFGQQFVHTGKVSVEFHRFLIEGQELRHTGDYGERHAVTFDQAREQLAHAEQFLELAERLIGPLPPTEP